jgi:hypothetical protein
LRTLAKDASFIPATSTVNLPDFLRDEELNSLRAQMGAKELGAFRLEFNVYRFTVADLEQVVDSGIALDDMSRLRTLEDKTLAYKERRVLLHPRDLRAPAEPSGKAPPLPPFHVGNCSVVRQWRADSLPPPLLLADRDDGLFHLLIMRGATEYDSVERLPVCEACLAELAYAGFVDSLPSWERREHVERFSVREFFERYPRSVAAAP